MAVMPEQKPHKSEQVVVTPDTFMDAVKKRLDLGDEGFMRDLAANADNTKADWFYTEEDDALKCQWTFNMEYHGWNWCNPPYSDLGPWVEKAWAESRKGAKIAMLIPASVGSNYWAKWVDGKAYVTFLNGRITFVGHKGPYPKDLVLLLYTPYLNGGSCVWRWKDDI